MYLHAVLALKRLLHVASRTEVYHAEGVVDLAKDYQSKGVAMVAISSNSVKTHPQDGPEEMASDAQTFGKPPS